MLRLLTAAVSSAPRLRAAALVLLAAVPRPQSVDDPRAVVREVTAAVEADSAAATRAKWDAVLARDSANATAVLAVATVARLTYDYSTAERLYRRLYSSGPPNRYSAYARLGLATGLFEQGRLATIDPLLVKARTEARAVHDGAAEGKALFTLARVRVLTQGAQTGIAMVDTLLRIIPEDATDVRAAARCLRAHFMTVVGGSSARSELRAALAYAREVGDRGAEAGCVRVLALEHRFGGQYDSSLADIRRLEELRRQTHDRSRLAEALFLRGEGLLDLAAYGQAREALQMALVEAAASHNLYVEGAVQLALAVMFFRLNDNVTAAGYLNRAAADYEAQSDTGSLMMARSWRMQVNIAAGQFAAARQETNEVIDFFRGEGDIPHLGELYQTLADIAMRQRDWDGAQRALDQAAALFKGHSSAAPAAAQLSYRGRLALYRGDLDQADRDFRKYLGGLDSTDRLVRYETRAYLGEIYARRRQLDSAEREMALAGAELDAWRATLQDRELRALAFQASSSEANDRNASIARTVALLAAGGRARAAFELAEHRRGRDLADRMQRARALVPGGVEDRDAPARTTAADASPAHTLAALIPDEHTVVVEYVSGAFASPTTVFVLRRSASGPPQIHAATLAPADSLAVPIGRLVAVLEGGREAPDLARSLGDAVLGPILSDLGPDVNRVIIVPDGPLHRVPFDALRLPDGHYAAERFAISLAPSAMIVAELWREGPGREATDGGSVRLLAFGDPTFARDSAPPPGAAGTPALRVSSSAVALPRLQGSGEEVRHAAEYVPAATLRLREEASAAYLKHTDLADYRILHFATHAVVDDYTAGATALVLSPGEGETGFVSPGELEALRLGADLVVLSACRSAGGVVVDGEGIQGLTAPLLQAGARSIVATGWQIGDRATLDLVDGFYAGLAGGLPAGDALQSAKLHLLRQGRPAGEWAAFNLVGDPLVRIPLRRPAPSALYWLAGAALLAAGVACGLWHARRPVDAGATP